MLILRPYKPSDAKYITNWFTDELSFRKWTSDRYDTFPITETDINNKYFDWNGDCVESDNFYPLTAVDEQKNVVGHLIMRYINGNPKSIRLGWIIIDNQLRGQGIGKEMLLLSIKYAFEILKAEKITLGVFDSNMQAYYCYTSVGFKDIQIENPETYNFYGEIWNLLELELKKEDYENRNSRKTIFNDSSIEITEITVTDLIDTKSKKKENNKPAKARKKNSNK